jgi:hypothetical protein
MVTKAEVEELVEQFKAASEKLINAVSELANQEPDYEKSSKLSRCLEGLESEVYDPNGVYCHTCDTEGIVTLERYLDDLKDDDKTI